MFWVSHAVKKIVEKKLSSQAKSLRTADADLMKQLPEGSLCCCFWKKDDATSLSDVSTT